MSTPTDLSRGSELLNPIDPERRQVPGPQARSKTTGFFIMTNRASEKFIDHIQTARRDGYGFVPLIGAGFSAPSGLPIMSEIESYLRRCIFLAVRDLTPEPHEYGWHPRTDQWPPLTDSRHREESREHWPNELYKALGLWWQELGVEAPRQQLAVLAQAYGAAAEWQSSLLFLSRLDRGQRNSEPCLTVPHQEIIDACFREVLKSKSPALNHVMLGVLAGALRLNLLLTTNFDNLLEQGFAAARNPLEVFEVHLGDSLPHWSAVSEVRSLIKLHGNRHSLRADYSLDAGPSEEDKQRFLQYLLGSKGSSDWKGSSNWNGIKHESELEFQNHLLVMGASGKESRIKNLVEYAWEHLPQDFRVFWLCYSDDDVRRVVDLTRGFCLLHTQPKGWIGSIILRHTNFGLLLLQLYQTIRKNLPPFGGVFPAVSRLSLPPLPSTYDPPGRTAQADAPRSAPSFCSKVLAQLEDFEKPEFLRENCGGTRRRVKLVVVTTPDEHTRGLTSACSKVFSWLETDRICLWLDMNDIASAENLFETLLEAAYFRLGLEDWVPVYGEAHPNRADQLGQTEEIRRLADSTNKKWVIFLNARETPGANTTESANVLKPKYPNGWLDVPEMTLKAEGGADESSCTERFLYLVEQLCRPAETKPGEGNKQHISVVLMCREGGPGGKSGLLKTMESQHLLANHIQLESGMRETFPFPFNEGNIVADAVMWTANNTKRQTFLQALVLMQRPRLLATVWSDATLREGDNGPSLRMRSRVLPRNGGTRDPVYTWLDDLEKLGLIRRKAGGFIWMHSRCREHMREVFRNPSSLAADVANCRPAQELLETWRPNSRAPEIHTRLARWYEKVLDASDAPPAVFEAVYHLCLAAEGFGNPSDRGRDLSNLCQRLNAAAALLKGNSFLIQTQGYARGSCRRLKHIRDIISSRILPYLRQAEAEQETASPELEPEARAVEACRQLQVICTEVMRAIAREVGETEKAYLRHRQVGRLKAGVAFAEKPEADLVLGKHLISKGVFAALRKDKDPILGHSEWVRWWRWSGMLAIASGSYDAALSAFSKALQCVRYPHEYPHGDRKSKPVEGRGKRQSRVPRGVCSQETKVEELRVVEQYADLLLMKYSLNRRLGGVGVDLKSLREIEQYISHGRQLAWELRGADCSSSAHSTMIANGCESRLLIHQSVCTSRRLQLVSPNKRKILDRAMGLLGDAEMCLRLSDPRRYNAELAMVELHRAQARLWSAEVIEVCRSRGVPQSLGAMWTDLERTIVTSDRQRAEVLSNYDRNIAALRQAKSLVSDGINFLNRAEPILRKRRRNVRWTTWFFERYLRAIAMSLWASVFEDGTPIPFLGLEAAPADTESLADRLLDDALRLIGLDTYRIATIVDAYASCAKALELRLWLDQKSWRLISRQRTMREKLKGALDALDTVEAQRDGAPVDRSDKNSKVDSQIIEYVHATAKRCEEILHKHLGL
jgi:hypothetical protein